MKLPSVDKLCALASYASGYRKDLYCLAAGARSKLDALVAKVRP